MNFGLIPTAAAMFAVTNIDDILILSLFFGQARGKPEFERRVVIGQYAGFGAILMVSVIGGFGASLLPESVLGYLGLVPLLLGIKAAVEAFRHNDPEGEDGDAEELEGPTVGSIAALTLANGGDNVGVYVPVFAAAGTGGIAIYAVVFLVMVALWCIAGRFLATRPPIARVLNRWGHVLMPVVLIGIGVVLLVEGGAFGL